MPRPPLLCAPMWPELLPLFLPLNGQFWSGKGSIIQEHPGPGPLENRTFWEKPGLDRRLFLQFDSRLAHHKVATI